MHINTMDIEPKNVTENSYEQAQNKGQQQHGCSAGQSSAVSAAAEKT